jgi:hypothetical protein
MNATVAIEKITPAAAQILLEDQIKGQRKLRQSYVDRLAQEMRQGRWKLTSDGILICKGKLANGQHRLSAVVQCGLSFDFFVVRTDDEMIYKVIDCGLKRTDADALAQCEYAQKMATVARLVVAYDKGLLMPSNAGSGSCLARGDVIDYCERNSEKLKEAIQFATPLYVASPIVPASMMAALFIVAMRRYDHRVCEEFVEAVYTGNTQADAAFDLRQRLIRNSAGKAKLPRNYIMAITIKSFNAFVAGVRLKVLRMVDGEQFPAINKLSDARVETKEGNI